MAHGGPDYSISTITGGGGAIIQPQKPYYNRDVVNRVAGDVVCFDPSTVQGALACTKAGDPRVLGVVADASVAPGVMENLYYHGQGLVRVIGTGSAGAALVTSVTAGAAQASGTITNQPGFVGCALQSWAGPGLILADIDVQTQLWGGLVNIEGVLTTNNNASGNLQCGNNTNRAVFALVGMNNGQQALTAPTINGVSMTPIGPQLIGYGETGSAIWQMYINSAAVPSGLVPVVGGQNAGNIGATEFVAVSDYSNHHTAVGSGFSGVSSVALQCTDAAVGDNVLGFLMIANIGGSTGFIISPPTYGNAGTQLNIIRIFQNEQVCDAEIKPAGVWNETINWTLNANHSGVTYLVPMIPA
jgi:hypothetical protein